jgi:chromosome segregation ATPase
MSNTKKELLEAYEAAKQRLQSLDKDLLDAEKAKKRLEKQVAAATADSQAAQDPLQRLHDLRGAISRELTGLAERFETEIETYRKIQAAVEVKREEIKTIYEVETAASDLAALIDAHRVKKQQFELEMEERKAAFEEEMNEAHARWKREKAERDRQVQEQADAIKKQRKREKEEYEYAFLREKEQRKNDLEDELRALEKEMAQKREDFEQEYHQRKADLDAREAVLEKREKEMAALQKEVDTFPRRLENAVQKAVDDTTTALTREFEKDKALMESRFEGEKNVLAGKIESLEKMVAFQAARISDLSKSHEKAYEKVQDIANRAVAAAKREVYSVPIRSTAAASARDENQND